MALILQGYKIENPAFADAFFTASSADYLALPDAVIFGREQGGVLQSARDAAAFRVEANGQDSANLSQVTRTVVAYMRVDGRWYGAVDDIADPVENLILARADEGYNTHKGQNKWGLPKTNRYVRGILERAERDGRMFEVSEQSRLELAIEQKDGVSAFGAHAGIRAILGSDNLPEAYAAFLNQNGEKIGRFYNLTPPTLDKLGIGDDTVEIRFAGFGSSDHHDLASVFAGVPCTNGGHARRIRFPEPVQSVVL